MKNNADLRGQVGIVTGGGRGIGKTTAIALAKAGMSVAVVARTESQLSETVETIRGDGGTAESFAVDVTIQSDVIQMVSAVETQIGPVDLLVNNAGISGPGGPFSVVSPDEWWNCIEINLRGPFLCTKAVLPKMIARSKGRIIMTSSAAALGTGQNLSAYAISKGAVARLAESLSVECAEQGIKSFAIHPGFVRTALVESVAASPADDKWFGGGFKKAIAEGDFAPPELAADLTVLLASGRADALSGCYISVDDDVIEMISRAEAIAENRLHKLRLLT